jgi:hypothetical protein
MRKLILAMQMTLDGFIAGPNGDMDWIISAEEEWKGFRNKINPRLHHKPNVQEKLLKGCPCHSLARETPEAEAAS